MAGCLPAYMPVLLAALEAMADPAYNLHGSAASTGGAAPLMVVNGPVRNEIGMNGGGNVFGPGNRANAAIGRAVRLVLINCLGAVPHLLDRSTQGNPGKYSFTLAENEEASPWEPLHAERGFHPERSAVTLLAAEGPHNIQNHYGRAEGVLRTAAHTMASLGSLGPGQGFVVFAPEHANLIAGEFPGKRAVPGVSFRAHGGSAGAAPANGKDRRPRMVPRPRPCAARAGPRGHLHRGGGRGGRGPFRLGPRLEPGAQRPHRHPARLERRGETGEKGVESLVQQFLGRKKSGDRNPRSHLRSDGGPRDRSLEARPARRGLEGKRVGTLWNGKVGGDKLMRFVLEELRAGGADLRLALERRKDTDTRPAKPEACDEIARECDLVLISLGD